MQNKSGNAVFVENCLLLCTQYYFSCSRESLSLSLVICENKLMEKLSTSAYNTTIPWKQETTKLGVSACTSYYRNCFYSSNLLDNHVIRLIRTFCAVTLANIRWRTVWVHKAAIISTTSSASSRQNGCKL